VSGGGGRVDKVLADLDPDLSRSLAGRLARAGRVTRDGSMLRPSDLVRDGDRLSYAVPAAPAPLGAEPIGLDVVYEDADLVVVDKPAGMVVHPAPQHAEGTLAQALLGIGGTWSTVGGAARPGIVHRLDKGTSGLILAARTDAAHRSLAAQLADRTLSRTYLAVARGEIRSDEMVLEGPVARHPRDRLRMAVVEGGRAARTRCRVVERRGGHTLVQCELETGRTHQIRVHLSALGHPIAGDALYARARTGDPDRPMLHAWRLRFRHPRTGRTLQFEADPPADFSAFWDRLR
jgi:23S rRNA pseudouridine1911/1915/1917 synthase